MHSIREQAIQQGLADLFEEILVPMEEVVEVKRGKKVSAERKFFPGYVLVKMELTDETWHLVRNTAKVTGFSSSSGRPVPIADAEAERILRQMQEGIEHPRPLVTFMSGDQVRVVDGPFSSFNGVVEEVDEGEGRLKVSVSIFGRATPVELEYSQVESCRVTRAAAGRRRAGTAPAEEPSMAKKIVGTSSCRCRQARPIHRRRSVRRSASAASTSWSSASSSTRRTSSRACRSRW